jgi:L-alanine-DL-glutamate epimerase-like enolase superfamily enzyme
MLDTGFERLSLPLADPFTISRGTKTAAENVVVRITDADGTTGFGAAAPSTRFGETAGTVEAVLPDLLDAVERVGDPHARQRIERERRDVVRDNPAAHAAVDVALADLAAKRLAVPLFRQWGLDPDATPRSSFTIGLDSTDRMREKAADAVAAGHDVLKVKVGTDRDPDLLSAVRAAAPDARLRVDANGAWGPREAVGRIEALAAHDIAFVEQPVAADDPAGLRHVAARSPLPIAADESCVTPADIPAVAEWADIATVKLMKCGGVGPARRLIHAARAHGLDVMLGCMIETNAAIAAACHLAPLVDYADLDGSLLLESDPYAGVPIDGDGIHLAALDDAGLAGTGARSDG